MFEVEKNSPKASIKVKFYYLSVVAEVLLEDSRLKQKKERVNVQNLTATEEY